MKPARLRSSVHPMSVSTALHYRLDRNLFHPSNRTDMKNFVLLIYENANLFIPCTQKYIMYSFTTSSRAKPPLTSIIRYNFNVHFLITKNQVTKSTKKNQIQIIYLQNGWNSTLTMSCSTPASHRSHFSN